MSRLDEAAKSVNAGPSPADDEILESADDLDLDASAAGDADDSDDEQGEGTERTAENVRREVLRKMEKSQKEMMAKLEQLGNENQSLRAQLTNPAQPVAQNGPKTYDDLSVQELIQIQNTIPADQKAAFDAYLIERKVDERVDAKLGKFESTSSFKQQEDKFNQTAYDRWPQLRQKGSEFYGIADRILSGMGKAADTNPRAVLDAANEAGLELGLAPATSIRTPRRAPGNVAPGRSTKSASAPDPVATENDKAIASRLANAMPGKKFTKEQLKRIAKRSAQYQEQINTHVRG
jgi:hypothetical protein